MRPQLSLTVSEEDSDDTSESKAESLLLDKESVESDDPPEERAKAVHLSLPLWRNTHWKQLQPGCYLCDHEIRGNGGG